MFKGGTQEPGQEIFLAIVYLFSPYMHPLSAKLDIHISLNLIQNRVKQACGTPLHFSQAGPLHGRTHVLFLEETCGFATYANIY